MRRIGFFSKSIRAGELKLALALLGLLLATGCADLRLAREDYLAGEMESAQRQWESLALRGFPEAEYGLATLYAGGHMGADRIGEAMIHYQRAMELGDGRAYSAAARFLIRHSRRVEDPEYVVQQIRTAADEGSVYARLAMSDLYLDGLIVEADPEKALALLESLDDLPEAAYRLGELYRDGIYVPQDYDRARAYFRQAADSGSQGAMVALADFHLNGWAVPKDVGYAKSLLSDLADQGNLSARYKLAGILEQEDGGAGPSPETLAQYRKASAGGYAPAKFRMADFYLRGRGLPEDVDRAMGILYDLSARDYGPASARLGDLYRDGNNVPLDYQRALSFYELAFEQGFAHAETRIAKMLHHGWGVDRDLAAALAIYRRHASKGDVNAAYGCARVLEDQAAERGQPFPEGALEWYRRAADAGHVSAGLRLAELYLYGEGVEQNTERALAMLQALSDRGEGEASLLLGRVYAQPFQTYSDFELARDYLEKAVDQGEPRAVIALADLYARPGTVVEDEAKATALYQRLYQEGNIPVTYKLARLLERKLGRKAVTPEIVNWYRIGRDAHYPPSVIRYADLQLEGVGLPQDVEAALDAYRDLSARGVGQATFRLGKMYEFGLDGSVDYRKAAALYRKSRQQGYPLAELQLARFYAEGLGMPQDLDRAIAIYRRFDRQRNEQAALALGYLYRKLEPERPEKAERWFLRATELGSSQAWFELAMLYEAQAGQPTLKSVAALKQADAAGHGQAKLLLGDRKFTGRGIEQDRLGGLALMLEAARLQVSDSLKLSLQRMDEVRQPGLITEANTRARQRIKNLLGRD